jgi:hypothetical protein
MKFCRPVAMVATIIISTFGFGIVHADDDSAGYCFLTGGSEDAAAAPSDLAASPSACHDCLAAGDRASDCCSRWTASAEFIVFDRVGSANWPLVERVPGTVPLADVFRTPGVEALNASDFRQGFAGGPKLTLTRRNDSGYDWEISYFQIDGWSDSATIGPDVPANWLVMRAPGGFLQTQDHPDQGMAWTYASKLYNAESNLRWNFSDRIALLAGIRWINFSESLVGTLLPDDGFPPFWNTKTNNNLYGLQIGAEGIVWKRGRFSLSGLLKAGVFDNEAEESTGVSIFKVVRPSQNSTHHAAFLGETGLQCRYQATKGLALKLGYEAIWLQGVALAPGQIQETQMSPLASVDALGVNCDSGVFFHGATAGLEYSF